MTVRSCAGQIPTSGQKYLATDKEILAACFKIECKLLSLHCKTQFTKLVISSESSDNIAAAQTG